MPDVGELQGLPLTVISTRVFQFVQMNYDSDGETHSLSMSKDEFLSLISILYEGLENLRGKARGKNRLASEKYENAEAFMKDLSRRIMTGEPAKID